MKKFLVTIALAALAAPMFAQNAAPQRVAVIDYQKVLLTSVAGKATSEKFKKLVEDREAQGQKLQGEIKKLEDDINGKKMSLSEEKLSDMQKQLSDKRIALQRYGQDAQRELEEAEDREMAALQSKVLPVITAIGKEMGLAAVFSKFQSGLLYASDAIDITDTVIKRFDATSPAAPAAAPAAKK